MDALIARFGQLGMYVIFAGFAVLFYLYGIILAVMGWWGMLFPSMLIISPFAMALLRILFEGPLTRSFVNPRVMSWSFVLGDSLVLPSALLFAGRGWQGLPVTASEAWWSMLVYAVIGLGVMVGFRKFDGDRYRNVGWGSSLQSPTKVWHDCVVMPVVVALLAWLLIPQLLMGMSVDTFFSIGLLLIFGGLVAIDALNPPDPRFQHCRWDRRAFEPIGSI